MLDEVIKGEYPTPLQLAKEERMNQRDPYARQFFFSHDIRYRNHTRHHH